MITEPLLLQPSYRNGYAKGADESAYPGLWGELIGAWVPFFGNTGSQLIDLTATGNRGIGSNLTLSDDWSMTEKGSVIDIEGTDTFKIPASFLTRKVGASYAGALTACIFLRGKASGNYRAVLDTTNRHLSLFFAYGSDLGFYGLGGISAAATFRSDDVWRLFSLNQTNNSGNPNRFGYQGTTQIFAHTNAADDYTQEIEIGGNPSGGGTTGRVQIGMILVYKRSLVHRDRAILSSDPLAPFRLRSRLFAYDQAVPVAGGPPKGSLSLLGVGV